MPFSLGQIFGGWKRKGDAKKTVRFSDRNSSLSAGKAGRVQAIHSNSGQKKNIYKNFSGEKRVIVPSGATKGKSDIAWKIIRTPHISEKGTMLGDYQYIFKVSDDANKQTVKQAIEERYEVKVNSVHIINTPTKPRRRGQVIREKPGFKKAIISLKAGNSIAEF
jgi:large subunit ribosomal protein L23